jgi:threonine dehydrogenase-like Zn-dependent dehydrogenase
LHPIVAADYSPARRALAEKLGADVVVDPARTRPRARRCRRGCRR